jgi:hypothetical protein
MDKSGNEIAALVIVMTFIVGMEVIALLLIAKAVL